MSIPSPLVALTRIHSHSERRQPNENQRKFETRNPISPRLSTAGEAGVLSLHMGFPANGKIAKEQPPSTQRLPLPR